MKSIFLTVMMAALLFGCDQMNKEDEEPANVYAKIKGTWTISSMNMFGIDIPGDGSALTFDYCDEAPCTGQDYEASGGTTGTFTYEFIENDSKIVIVDEDANGGNYNTTWAILDFGSSNLRMTGEFSIFGNMQLDMNK
jgi:hypothetical protein